MTITQIDEFYDLMNQTSKEKEYCTQNATTSNVPSIVITSGKVAGKVTLVTAADVHHQQSVHTNTNQQSIPSATCSTGMNESSAFSSNKRSPKMNRDSVDQTPLSNSTTVPICIEHSINDATIKSPPSIELEPKQTLSRPTTLEPNQVLPSPSKPPELSISPADSLSKVSSNEQLSSNMFASKFKTPHSPSSLSVNFCK